MLILLPPSESKANRRRGRPADPSTWSFPELGPTRARVADALAQVSRSPEAPALLGVSPGLLGEVARNLVLDTAPATPAAEVYTGVLYDALGLATLDTAARRRANRWLVVVSALHGAVRPGDRITAYRLSMGSTLPGLGPLAQLWRPALDEVLPPSPPRGSSSTAGRRRMPPRGARVPPSPHAGCRCGCPAPATWPSTPGDWWHGTCARSGWCRARCRPCATSWPVPSTCASASRRTAGPPGSWTWCPGDRGGCRRPPRAVAARRRLPPRHHGDRRGRRARRGVRRGGPLGRARRTAPGAGRCGCSSPCSPWAAPSCSRSTPRPCS